MIRKLFISFLCVASLGLAANAQATEEGGVMTLHDCMAYAVSNSTKMRIQQAASCGATCQYRPEEDDLMIYADEGQIFIPFYTTKKEGSGIGLSLARQIMRQHNGTIDLVRSDVNQTVFQLIFR